jgi:hypothetical protein
LIDHLNVTVYRGVVTLGGAVEGSSTAPLLVSIGGGHGATVERAAGLFSSAGIVPTIPHDVLYTIWIRYAINAGLWPPMVRASGLQ